MPVVESKPCRKGHLEGRNKFGQCPACLRETRTAYRKRAPKIELIPAVEAPVILSAEDKPAPGSFLAVAREWLESQDDVAPKTAIKREYLLAQLRSLHARPIAEITTPEIVRVLKEIEAVGDRRETAHRAGMFLGQITAYAAVSGYAPTNALPSGTLGKAKVLKPIKIESHPAITDPRPGDSHDSAPKRFGRLLDAMLTYEFTRGSRNHPSVGAALALTPYVFTRPGELRNADWSEFSLERAEWTVPAGRMKMRRPFLVPLSKQALAILKQQHAASGGGRYVFPAKARTNARKGEQPISENAFREALDFILTLMREPKGAMTMHGFRSIASTLLKGQLRVESELVELQLAHAKSNKIASIYDRDQRVPERTAMMQKWADYVDDLRAGARKEAPVTQPPTSGETHDTPGPEPV